MEEHGVAMPVWLLILNALAVLLLATGGIRLYLPDLAPLNGLPEPVAWTFAVLGLACLAVFWARFLRDLQARRLRR